MKKLLKIINNIKPILLNIINVNGIPYLVGGVVRDLILKRDNKDLDIEVHNILFIDLENILRSFGNLRYVGKKFGVLRIDGIDIDWSLPRSDLKGRKPEVIIDSKMTIEKALHRRDLTMNAMAIDLKKMLNNNGKYEIIDPYGGLKDIKDKVLRVVDKILFLQDPLRFFRVMQFVGRFEMLPDRALDEICKKMKLHDFISGKNISKERIFEEIKKMFLKSKKPSISFKWLKHIYRLQDIFPEIYALIGVKQKKEYHPEGDVFEHTMQAIDAAAEYNEYKDDNEKLLIIFAVLCHDFGKPETTSKDLSAKGHEMAGVEITKQFLKKIIYSKFFINSICKLVMYHMRLPVLISNKAKLNVYKRLAIKLAPQVNLRQLALVVMFDRQGRNPKKGKPLKGIFKYQFDQFLTMARQAGIDKGPEEPILKGRHLLDFVEPGLKMGRILRDAYKIQIEYGIKDVEELKKRVLDK